MGVRWVSDGWQMGVRWVSDGCQMGVRWVSDPPRVSNPVSHALWVAGPPRGDAHHLLRPLREEPDPELPALQGPLVQDGGTPGHARHNGSLYQLCDDHCPPEPPSGGALGQEGSGGANLPGGLSRDLPQSRANLPIAME